MSFKRVVPGGFNLGVTGSTHRPTVAVAVALHHLPVRQAVQLVHVVRTPVLVQRRVQRRAVPRAAISVAAAAAARRQRLVRLDPGSHIWSYS
jgi:hypothetical protein